MGKGHLAIILHAHLPYVRHPEYQSFLEERWFFEVMTETYIPLIKVLTKIAEEKIPCGLTFSLSPTLLCMMNDPILMHRYRLHLEKLIELSEKELQRHSHHGHLHWLASTYKDFFCDIINIFDSWGAKPARAFLWLHKMKVLQLVTTSATHAILPLLASEPKALKAQIRFGIDAFRNVFGFDPQGFWLPECAYIPGLEEPLREEGIRYFFLESHGIEHANVLPLHGVYAPLYTPSGVAGFARDQACTEEVWSANKGFPGDPVYREFYCDIGHEADFNYIKPYLPGDVRVDTGIKYWRITGHRANKEFYDPYRAKLKAEEHAAIFLERRKQQIQYITSTMDGQVPIVTATFDAELFGHWWFEGPQWLDFLIRKSASDTSVISLISPLEYLDQHPMHQFGVPGMSSWGSKGFFDVWCNGKTDWVLTQVYECIRRMVIIANKSYENTTTDLTYRALNQCVRELLLAQCSDWPFIITNGTAEQYASRRIRDHVSRFHFLADSIENKTIDEQSVKALEFLDCIFPDVDYRFFSDKNHVLQ